MKQYLGAAILVAGAALPAAAQERPSQAGQTGYVALDPITVFATLNATSAFEFPGEVSVIDRQQIDIQQPSSLGEALKYVPGVYSNGGARSSGQSPNIRGFQDENVLILVDGVRQDFQSGHQGRAFIDPDLLKTIEIVKGPASALYGSGALGGVIAMTTVDASDFLAAGETAGYRVKAGWQTADGQLQLSTTAFARSADQKFDVIGSFTYRRIGNIELGNDATLPNRDNIKSAFVKASGLIAPDLKITASWVHFLDNAITPDNPQGNNVGGQNDEGLLLQNVDRKILSDTVSAKVSYAPAGNNYIDGNFLAWWAQNKVVENTIDIDRTLSRAIETVGVNVDNRSRFALTSLNGKVTFTYGAEYHTDRQSSQDTCPVGGAGCFQGPGGPIPPSGGVVQSAVPSAQADYAGVFAQAEFKFAQPLSLPGELTIIPGARFDTFSNSASGQKDFSDEAVSPKIAANYKPVPWFFAFGSYGEAFRAPSYNELYAIGNHFPLVGIFGPGSVVYNRFVANPDLKPQDGETAEAGAGFDFKNVLHPGDSVRIKGSYYRTEATNYIALDVFGFGSHGTDFGCFIPGGSCTSKYVNIPRAILTGGEIEARYDSSRFFGSVGWSTITGRNAITNEYLETLQPDRVIVNAGVKLPEYWTQLGSRFTFADKFDRVNSSAQIRGAYNLVDLYASIEPASGPFKGFRLDLGIDNVTDEAYEVVAAKAYEKGINYKGAVTWTQKW